MRKTVGLIGVDKKINTLEDVLNYYNKETNYGDSETHTLVKVSNFIAKNLPDSLAHFSGEEWPIERWPLDVDYGSAVLEISLNDGEQDFVVDIKKADAIVKTDVN